MSMTSQRMISNTSKKSAIKIALGVGLLQAAIIGILLWWPHRSVVSARQSDVSSAEGVPPAVLPAADDQPDAGIETGMESGMALPSTILGDPIIQPRIEASDAAGMTRNLPEIESPSFPESKRSAEPEIVFDTAVKPDGNATSAPSGVASSGGKTKTTRIGVRHRRRPPKSLTESIFSRSTSNKNPTPDVVLTGDGPRYVDNRFGHADTIPETDVWHRVKKGDTLYGIATYYYGPEGAVKIKDIIAANKSINGSADLKADMDIIVPKVPEGGATVSMQAMMVGTPSSAPDIKKTTSPSADRNVADTAGVGGVTHIIVKGDTLFTIARRYYGDGRRWRTIYDANRETVSDPNILRAGQRIVIPGVTVSKTRVEVAPNKTFRRDAAAITTPAH